MVIDKLVEKQSPIPVPRSVIILLIAILMIGTFLRLPPHLFQGDHAPLSALARLHPSPGFTGLGIDEALYRSYVNSLVRFGLSSYPDIAGAYIEAQTRLAGAVLPPTRFLYVFTAYSWHCVFGTDPLIALHDTASLFSILLLILSAAFAWRLGGSRIAVCVAALMACAPLQIHMGQHALIDGFFAFWATVCLWMLWENLRQPNYLPWLILYSLSLALLVLTKENAAFVYFALLVALGLNRWLRFGAITPALLGCTILGALAGVVTLAFLCGGVSACFKIYTLLISKASVLPYAIATGDGPWYRYLVDLLLISPLVLILALGKLLNLRRTDTSALYLFVFVAASYVVMCNVRYGMNLRYADIWDLPIRYLAVLAVADIANRFAVYRTQILGSVIGALALFDLHQYRIFFVDHDLYELVSSGLLQVLRILK